MDELGHFTGIDSLTGQTGTGNWLYGENAASLWSLGTSQSYKDNTDNSSLSISGFDAQGY